MSPCWSACSDAANSSAPVSACCARVRDAASPVSASVSKKLLLAPPPSSCCCSLLRAVIVRVESSCASVGRVVAGASASAAVRWSVQHYASAQLGERISTEQAAAARRWVTRAIVRSCCESSTALCGGAQISQTPLPAARERWVTVGSSVSWMGARAGLTRSIALLFRPRLGSALATRLQRFALRARLHRDQRDQHSGASKGPIRSQHTHSRPRDWLLTCAHPLGILHSRSPRSPRLRSSPSPPLPTSRSHVRQRAQGSYGSHQGGRPASARQRETSTNGNTQRQRTRIRATNGRFDDDAQSERREACTHALTAPLFVLPLSLSPSLSLARPSLSVVRRLRTMPRWTICATRRWRDTSDTTAGTYNRRSSR